MEASLINLQRFPASCFAFGIRRMAGGSALIFMTQESIPARFGKWTRTAKGFTRFFRTGKSHPSSVAEIGRRTAITIIFWRGAGVLKTSGGCRGVGRFFADAPRAHHL